MIYLGRNYEEGLDLLTFFPRENSISAHLDLWPSCLMASLRLKNSVLITAGTIPLVNTIDQSKRWVTGPDWCWLAPRSLSTIEAYFLDNPPEFQNLLTVLRTSK